MLTATLLKAVMTVAIGTAPSASLEGTFSTDSIESAPALIRGSAAISIARDPGNTTYRAKVTDMKSFGVELSDPPETIHLAGQISSSRPTNSTHDTLNLIGTYKSAGSICFLRLNVKPATPRSLVAAGWLTCGSKKIEVGFSAARASDVSRGLAAVR